MINQLSSDQPVVALAFVTLIDYLSGFLAAATQYSYATEGRRIRTGQRAHWCVNVPMAPCPVLLLRRHQPGNLVANMTGSAARLGGSPGPVFIFRIKQGCAWSR